ncbi:putative phage associated protein [Clostridium sp. CAG:813]|nr:putative phage associated protein [Clostridium sp. CAG:813]
MGASIPQVKGMEPVEFKEGESETYIFETQTEDETETEDIEELKNTIVDLKQQVADFKEKSQNKETIKELKTQVKNLNIELAKFKDQAAGKDELAKKLQDLENTIRDKDFNEFIDSQISAGVLTPANKDAVFNILQDLDNVKKFDESSNSIDNFKTFICALPKQVEFDEIAQKTQRKRLMTN